MVGYEHAYEVSDHGNVRSIPRQIFVEGDVHGCYSYWVGGTRIKPSVYSWSKREVRVSLRREGTTRQLSVMRLMWEAFVGPVPDGQRIFHRCDRTDDRLENMVLVTYRAHNSDGTFS